MNTDSREFVVQSAENGRLDAVVSSRMPDFSRSLVQKWIKDANITVNGKAVKASYHPVEGDKIKIIVPPPEIPDILPQPIPVDVLFEDEHIIVINKPPGLVVHPAPGHFCDTLVNALLYHCKNLSTINGVLRPGIVHRLDKDTSGVLVAAKTDVAHHSLAEQFANRLVVKSYIAIVAGVLSPAITTSIDLPIGRHRVHRKKMSVNTGSGKEALTQFTVLRQCDDCALLRVGIKTGRTHQIRVHLSHIGHPVIGDSEYGSRSSKAHYNKTVTRQLLHAFSLEIHHPVSNTAMLLRAKLPDDMRHFIKLRIAGQKT
ncbi:MAG: RluA family pseudouridine synthase [Candidatus Auribacter fodinae]|jgi:23S rRNA pseudouridine1911/1915/1917 synthase|uniref:Pseudouridine synthase n=1 Tax=Candidatus Auribacter fodinae TaxID=2093366 RepID=A0A3A4R5N5_9BACT|nr:MAG: RluA family pseudouridine synthase [Candidatus Auribacter fodinae]